jgi:hypothetical protein
VNVGAAPVHAVEPLLPPVAVFQEKMLVAFATPPNRVGNVPGIVLVAVRKVLPVVWAEVAPSVALQVPIAALTLPARVAWTLLVE